MSSPHYFWDYCHSEVLEDGLAAPDEKPSREGRVVRRAGVADENSRRGRCWRAGGGGLLGSSEGPGAAVGASGDAGAAGRSHSPPPAGLSPLAPGLGTSPDRWLLSAPCAGSFTQWELAGENGTVRPLLSGALVR